ncbi:hypothetical protein ANO11243_065270 [Dothideomycetidae sp. 11243]|nr:hypothetical protein ANO11243_065270 [fungal sp. No.11243]
MASDTDSGSGQKPLHVSTVVYIFLILTSILVPLRCYVRVHMMGKFGIDDIFLLIAQYQAFMIASGCVTLMSVQHQLGEYLTPNSLFLSTDLIRLIWINEVIYGLLILSVRLAIGALLLRILAYAGRAKTLVIIILVVAGCNALQFLVWTILQCRPVDLFWTDPVSSRCHERVFTIACYANSAINILTEWALAILPMYLAYKMMILKTRDRVAVAVVLGLGGCASIATCVRMAYLSTVLQGKGDIRYYCGVIYMWATIENGLAILAACLATFRPLLTGVINAITGGPDELHGALMRKPSQTTYACATEHGHTKLVITTRDGGVPEFSDVLLAQIEADELKQCAKSPDVITPMSEISEEKAMAIHVDIRVVDVDAD